MQKSLASEIKKLSVAERILLVEEIWDSINDDNEAIQLSVAQKEELDRRSRSFAGGRSWDEIKAEFMRIT